MFLGSHANSVLFDCPLNSPTEPTSPKHRTPGRSISGGPQANALNSSLHETSNGDVSEMKPFNHPDRALQDGLKMLGNEDW